LASSDSCDSSEDTDDELCIENNEDCDDDGVRTDLGSTAGEDCGLEVDEWEGR